MKSTKSMKSMLLVAAAFFCGVGASHLAVRLRGEPKDQAPTQVARADKAPAKVPAKSDDDIPAKAAFETPVPPGHAPVVDVNGVAGGSSTNLPIRREAAKGEVPIPVPVGHRPLLLEVAPERHCPSICWPIKNARVRLVGTKRDPDTGKDYSALLVESILVLDDRLEIQVAGNSSAGDTLRVRNFITVAARPEDIPRLEDAQRSGRIEIIERAQ